MCRNKQLKVEEFNKRFNAAVLAYVGQGLTYTEAENKVTEEILVAWEAEEPADDLFEDEL